MTTNSLTQPREQADGLSRSQSEENSQPRLDAMALSRLRTWIESKKLLGVEIGEDVDLIREGILDSLEMINFVLYIEEIRGEEIPESLVRAENFSSLRAVCQVFFRM